MVLFLLAPSPGVVAAPAHEEETRFVQPTGRSFTATRHGDEWLTWVTTRAGEILVRERDGF